MSSAWTPAAGMLCEGKDGKWYLADGTLTQKRRAIAAYAAQPGWGGGE